MTKIADAAGLKVTKITLQYIRTRLAKVVQTKLCFHLQNKCVKIHKLSPNVELWTSKNESLEDNLNLPLGLHQILRKYNKLVEYITKDITHDW